MTAIEEVKPAEPNIDPTLELIFNYEGIEEADDAMEDMREDNFKQLKAIAVEHGHLDGESFDNHLDPFINQYMSSKYDKIKYHARKRNGEWKIRRFQVDPSLQPKLDAEKIMYKQKTVKKKGVNVPVLEIMGVPDGFYSAWKTVSRALDKDIDIKPLSKSEIDSEIRKKNMRPKTVIAAGDKYTAIVNELALVMKELPQMSTKEKLDFDTLIIDLIEDLHGELNDKTLISISFPSSKTKMGNQPSSTSESGVSNIA